MCTHSTIYWGFFGQNVCVYTMQWPNYENINFGWSWKITADVEVIKKQITPKCIAGHRLSPFSNVSA